MSASLDQHAVVAIMSGHDTQRIHAQSYTLDDPNPAPAPSILQPRNLTPPISADVPRAPEIPASISYFVGVLMIIIVVVGLIENGTVLFVYSRTRKLRQANMSFVIGLSLSDMGQTALNLPFVAVACFYKRWVFGPYGCMYIGFVTTWFGLSQISLLCVIALERYFIIVQQCRRLSASTTRTVVTIVGCFIYGGGWAVAPLVGWSEYKLVAGEISCSLSWTLKNDLYLSYILALFSFVWFLPLGIITFSYIRIAQMVFLEKRKRKNMQVTKKVSKERAVAVTVFLMVGAFVISWTPYSVVALLTAFGDMSQASSGVYLIPAVFAKASIIWNPIIYIARHKEFRRACSRTKQHMFSWLAKHMTICAHFYEPPEDSYFSKSFFSDMSTLCGTHHKRQTSLRSVYAVKDANDSDPAQVDIHNKTDVQFKTGERSLVCVDIHESHRSPENESQFSSISNSSTSKTMSLSCGNVCESMLINNNYHNNRRRSSPAIQLQSNLSLATILQNNCHVNRRSSLTRSNHSKRHLHVSSTNTSTNKFCTDHNVNPNSSMNIFTL